MTTPVIIEGWEHGVSPTTSGGGLNDLVTSTPAVVTSPVRTGNYALRINPAAATQNAGRAFTAADVVVARGYIQFPSSLPAADSEVAYFVPVAGAQLNLRYDQSSNVFKIDFQGGTEQLHSQTLVANQWYRIDLKITFQAATRLCDWKVDGVDGPQASFTVAASQGNRMRWGTAVVGTYTAVYDDWVISTTSADYPFGAGEVRAISPTADGTHNPGVNEMEDNAGADIGVVTAYNLLDDVPMTSTADYVQQASAHTQPDAHYAEVAFGDISTDPKGVMGLLAYKASATQASVGATYAKRSDGTEIAIYGTAATPLDMSESSLFYKSAIITAPAGGWTQAEVNALVMRIGHSWDAAPLPQWHALMFQVDVATTDATPKSDSDTATESETSSLAVTASVTDTTTESEAVNLSAVATATDAAALSEGTPDIAQAVSDAATESEAAALAASATPTDAAALGEATDVAASATATDGATESEVASLAASPTVTDAATGGEAADLAASAGVTDTLSLAEAAQAEAQASGSDTATLADTGSVQQSGGDQSLEAQDAFALAETAALAASATPTDALALGDAADLAADLAGIDAAALGEGTPDVAQAVSDAATEGETAALAASATITDALAFAEATQTEAQASGADTATLTDLGTVAGEGAKEGQDTFVLAEAAVVTVSVVVQDSFAVVEAVGMSASLEAQDVLAVAEGQGAIAQSVTDALIFGDAATLAGALAPTDGFAVAEAVLIAVLAGAGDAFSLFDAAALTIQHIRSPLDAGQRGTSGTEAGQRGTSGTEAGQRGTSGTEAGQY